ncbi:HTH-type transcriptional activator mta [Clostridium puniceum]|uniref:HTH-type transcriptional activator mta n=1 Tax=Clostridium puniceum TaxID=29367 RepID=A0A1S8TMT5_9CLOT|nr:MerR family transcriptional regulator [Clostridium puniceum]OOM78745.1 HTH-type transcriptional activator mta [Clostridium puniceum]
MEYTVQKLGKLASVSTRTLRYYDEIGILKPARINSSGYRIYGSKEVNKLQQILFYRELGVRLEDIKDILTLPTFDSATALKEHREKLLAKRNQLDMLIANVDNTIAECEGRIIMSDKEKFEGFKEKLIEENEKKYGSEIRKKYGNNMINASNEKFKNMTKGQYDEFEKLGQNLIETLKEAFLIKDPASDLAQKAADLHRTWLSYSWNNYSKKTHAGLVQMYVADERFTEYYDKEQPGLAAFLRDAVLIYTDTK